MSDSPASSPRSDASSPRNSGDDRRRSWSEAASDKYHDLYDSWVPWLEDVYLKYFTKHNKASYATEDTLGKTKVTGIDQVDHLQDGVHGLVAGQVGQGGLAQPIGDLASREGVNRAERKGKDGDGRYLPEGASGAGKTMADGAQAVGEGGANAAKSVGGGVQAVGGAVGNTVGGLFGRGRNKD